MPLKLNDNKKEKETVTPTAAEKVEAKAKTEATVQATVPVTEAINPNLGILSDKIEFVACLGDPSVPDKDAEKGTCYPTIVGYRFKALADFEVPNCPPGDDFSAIKGGAALMSYTGNPFKDRIPVKEGQEFDLTKFETGALLSEDEFNSCVLGGKIKCSLSYRIKNKLSASGDAKVSLETPTVILKAIEGSIRDVDCIEVLSYTSQTNEKGKKTVTRTINKGFEKFAPLANTGRKQNRTGSAQVPTSAAASVRTVRNAKAETFLAIIKKKNEAAGK